VKVVVAGATGFIGSAAVRAIRAAGCEVVALGRGQRADGDVLVWAAGNRDSDRASHVDDAVAAARGIAHVIYLSTAEVYGDAPLPWHEDGPTLGTSDYARTKLDAEAALPAAAILRLGVVYGPGQTSTMVIATVARALAAREHVALTAGEQTRDFVFVDDVADAIVAALVAQPAIINIGSGVETRVRDAIELLAGGSSPLLGFGERAMRDGEARRYVLDIDRAVRLLGWRATTPLAAGLAACRG
jgi:nucleoside-diphosphate-sugar epimerase